MRERRRYRRGAVGAGLAAMLMFGWPCGAQAPNNPSQVLRLPDPTPREIDPRLRYQDKPAITEETRRVLAARNEKRRQLLVWATNELVVLSERADRAAAAPPGDAAKTELAVNVNKIETLAKNLALALRAK